MAQGDVPSDQLPEMMQLMLGDFWNTLQPIFEWLSLLLGGLFGLYLLYFLIKLYFDRKRIQLLKEVHIDVEFLKEHSLSIDELSKLRTILNTHPSVIELEKPKRKKKVFKNKKSVKPKTTVKKKKKVSKK